MRRTLPWGPGVALALLLGALAPAPRAGVAQEGERGQQPLPAPEPAWVTPVIPMPDAGLFAPPAPEPKQPGPSLRINEVATPQAGGGIGPAGPVAASVAYTSGNVITFTDMADFSGSIAVEWDDGSLSYYFYSADSLSAGAGCTQVTSSTAYCYAPIAVTISVLMGTGTADGNDQVALYDLDAADTLGMSGGEGADVLQVGAYGTVEGFGPTYFSGQGGNDGLFVFDNSNPTGSSYSVESTYVQRSGVNANYYDSTVDAVELKTSASDDSVYVGSTNASTQVAIFGTTGNDTVYVGTNFELDSLDGLILVVGNEGEDYIYVYDHGSLFSGGYSVTSDTLSRAGFGGLAFSAANEGLYLYAPDGANTFDVTGTNGTTRVEIYGGAGDDVFNVGPDLDAIQSKVRTHGGPNTDALLVDDSASPDADAIALNAAIFSKPNSGDVEFAEVEGLTLESQPQSANVLIENVGVPITVNTNAGDDNVFLFSGSAPVTVNGGAGNDGVTWGNGDLDSAPPATVNAGPGSDFLFVDDDQVSYSDSYYINASTFGRDFSYQLTYADFEQFYLQAEYGNNYFFIDSTDAGVPYYINARGGNDLAFAGYNPGNINAILGPIVFSGEGDLDGVYVLDPALVTPQTYHVRAGRIERLGGPADIDYTPDTEIVQLQAGADNDTINFMGTNVLSTTDIYANEGNDTVAVFPGGLATTGSAHVYCGANSDTIILNQGGTGASFVPPSIVTPGKHNVDYLDCESNQTNFTSVDSDLDGCPDVKESGLNPLFGGDRHPFYSFDWFDVTGDKAIDLADVVNILGYFGSPPGATPAHDRAVGAAPKFYRNTFANNGIDVADVIANLQSFGHTCV